MVWILVGMVVVIGGLMCLLVLLWTELQSERQERNFNQRIFNRYFSEQAHPTNQQQQHYTQPMATQVHLYDQDE